MKAISPCLFLLTIIAGCATSSVHRSLAPLATGYYVGSDKLFTIGFVNVDGDKVIADLIRNEKFPRDFLTDTLTYDGGSHTWKGKATELYRHKKSWFIVNSEPMFGSKIKLKANEGFYRENLEPYKNQALLRRGRTAYLDYSSDKLNAPVRYDQLANTFGLYTKAKVLSQREFLKEYETFKAHLNQ